ncbi:MAG: protoheme IX farnesyltransferase [Ignavibacteriales bacterium]|nr:protoheme IX farnesyltransferase [Ignavibacteriales bacterium]
MNDPSTLLNKEDITERRLSQVMRDFWLLMKPELTLLSVFTSLCSAYLAIQTPEESQILIFPLLAIGTLFVGGGSGALNQYFEREEDALMKRTEKRPVPNQRLSPTEALIFGITIALTGTVLLFVINWLTALLSLLTLVTYVFLYTPLKKISTLSTIIGAIPGALPTLIGWAAIRNSLSAESFSLFAILFYWQMPHFYSIGWLYRNDYIKAGFRLLTSIDMKGKKVSAHIIINQIILVIIGLSPAFVGLVQGAKARALFFSSLFYLPIIFSAMIIFKT